MKILLVGVLDVPWSTNCSMKRELELMGHYVEPFNYRTVTKTFCPAPKRLVAETDRYIDKLASFLRSDRNPLNTTWYYSRNGRREMNKLLLETVKNSDFDLVILSKADTVDFDLLPEINKYTRTWYFFMDPMDQAMRVNAAIYAKNATWASATFSDIADYFKEKGANAYWITQGVDTEIFKPKDVPKIYDIVFVGTKTKKRHEYIVVLREMGFSVTCFGEGWENPAVYQEDLVNIYNKTRIVLNFCQTGRGFSVRVFQVLGTGSFLLSEYCPDLEIFFNRGEHLDWFADQNELLEKAAHYLSNGDERKRIAEKGCVDALSRHSWIKKMAQIIEIVQPRGST